MGSIGYIQENKKMKESDIRKEFERIKGEYGNWTAHNIMLTDEIYTLSKEYDCRAKRRAQLYYDIINNYISKNWVRRKRFSTSDA